MQKLSTFDIRPNPSLLSPKPKSLNRNNKFLHRNLLKKPMMP